MKNADMPAFAQDVAGRRSDEPAIQGMTKREFAAIAIMQGCAASDVEITRMDHIRDAVRSADKLLAELEKTE